MFDGGHQKKYLREQILGSSPEELLLLMYDGAIRSLEESKRHAGEKDRFRFNELIVKTQNILAELMGALKPEIHPELSSNMARLYEFMFQHLVQANLKKDTRRIDEVMRLLKDLRETWRQAIDKAAMEKGSGAAPAASPGAKSGRTPSFSLQA